jgi:mercuric ion transport protein
MRKTMQSTRAGAPLPVRSGALSYLSLFTSLGTLLCCALPSVLVLFGLGATVASVLSEAPWLVTMSHHKHWVFLVAGVLISGNFVYLYAIAPKLQMRSGACDPNDPSACVTASRFGRVVLWCSAALYLIGCFTAYLLGPLLVRFDS